MSCTLRNRPTSRTLICCWPLLDKAAAGIDVVAAQLLLQLADAEAVGNELRWVHTHLVFPCGAPKAGDIHDANAQT